MRMLPLMKSADYPARMNFRATPADRNDMQTQFFHVTVEQCASQQTAPDNSVRLIASGQTFFYRDDFSDSEDLLASSPPAIG